MLAVASLAGGVWKIVGSEVVALGHTHPRLWSAIAGLVAMVAVDLVAVPSLGIAGAVLGSACGYVIAAVVVTQSWARDAALAPCCSASPPFRKLLDDRTVLLAHPRDLRGARRHSTVPRGRWRPSTSMSTGSR